MTEHGTSSDGGRRGGEGPGPSTDGGKAVLYGTIAPDAETAEYDLLELIADIEEVDIEDLPSLYTQVDHFVETLFEDPPSPESQMEISFSYVGYRITVAQTGDVKLVPVKDSIDGERSGR